VVILLILLGIIFCGLIAGLVMCPRARAAQGALATRVQALATRTGWRTTRDPVPPVQEAFPGINEVLGSTFHHGIAANLQLAGQWRGVPVRVLQLRFRTAHIATTRGAVLVMAPNPVPGPPVLVRSADDGALRGLPPAIGQRLAAGPPVPALFVTPQHVAVLLHGEIAPDTAIAAADLVTDLHQRMAVR